MVDEQVGCDKGMVRLPCTGSSTSSSTRFSSWSYPLSTPVTIHQGSVRTHVVLLVKGKHTFTSTCKLHADTRINVLGKVENCLAFGFIEGRLGTLRPAMASATRCGSASVGSTVCATALGIGQTISLGETGGGKPRTRSAMTFCSEEVLLRDK